MVETLAVEWGPYGIQVNGLVPGLMPHEDMTDDIQGNLVRTHDKDATQPALRVGQRQELGWAATFLASPFARFISGHTLVVDGAHSVPDRIVNVENATAGTRGWHRAKKHILDGLKRSSFATPHAQPHAAPRGIT